MFGNDHIDTTRPTALDTFEQLRELQAEWALASLDDRIGDAAYMADLRDEIEATRHSYVGAAVTEIATLRAQLSARQVG